MSGSEASPSMVSVACASSERKRISAAATVANIAAGALCRVELPLVAEVLGARVRVALLAALLLGGWMWVELLLAAAVLGTGMWAELLLAAAVGGAWMQNASRTLNDRTCLVLWGSCAKVRYRRPVPTICRRIAELNLPC